MLVRILLISFSLLASVAYATTQVSLAVIYDPQDPQQTAAYQGAQLAVGQDQSAKDETYKFVLTKVDLNKAADNLPIIISLGGNQQMAALGPILFPIDKPATSIVINAAATSVQLWQQYPQHYFSIAASDNVLAGAAAQFIFNQLHRERAIVLAQNDNPQSQQSAGYFANAFIHNNAQVVLQQEVTPKISPELINAMHSARARVIYLAANESFAISYIKQLRQAGIKLPIMLSADLTGSSFDKNWADGVFYTTQTYFDHNFESDEMNHFIKLYTELYKTKPTNIHAVLGYDATLLAMTAIEQSHTTQPQQLAHSIKQMKMFPAASGILNFIPVYPLKVVTVVKLSHGKGTIAAMSTPQFVAK